MFSQFDKKQKIDIQHQKNKDRHNNIVCQKIKNHPSINKGWFQIFPDFGILIFFMERLAIHTDQKLSIVTGTFHTLKQEFH